MFISKEKKQGLYEEIKNSKAIDHPFIVKIIDDFEDYDGHLCIVQEHYEQGDFNKYLKERKGKPFSEQEILHFLANIFLAVFHINSKNIFHRDLKPSNFLIKREANSKNYLYISDFGVAKNILDKERQSSAISNVKGTNEYLAPEIHTAKLEKPNMNKQDVWAIGVIAYELCTFQLPFNGEN
jgi:serine/threonine protein kinase